MDLPPNRRGSTPVDRREELRRARAAAPTLRVACPEAVVVRVELEFLAETLIAQGGQAFSIYPAAKAHFSYPCPFGDCDGVYDLNEIAFGSLQAGKRKTRGTLTCTGHRSRNGKSACLCELAASYSITVRLESEDAGVSSRSGG